ncbi:MAG: chorismate mutase [Firmicutes bacterium]|nr:chorismate mutase [Bacillota bacterium]
MTLDNLRAEIDAVDDELAALLARRMDLAARVAAIKRETGMPVFRPARERAILERLGARIEPQYLSALQTIYEAIFRASRAYQEGLI